MNPVWPLVDQALSAYRDSPRLPHLRARLARLEGPLRIAVTGAPESGRTTLLAAVVGEPVPGGRIAVEWPGGAELVEFTDGDPSDVDAVVHLLPHPGALPDTDPVSTVVALSRADELGGGRTDALTSARRVARRHASAELGERCQDVVAVAGLAGLGGALLTRAEVAELVGLAGLPQSDLASMLLSADRFTAHPGADELVGRLGLFGVRLAVELVRRGFGDSLGAELVHASGIADLREAITRNLVERAQVLRVRSALLAIGSALREDPRPALAAEVERALVSTHETRELRLLSALRLGRVSLGEADREARQLLGERGTAPNTRLALSGEPYETFLRWRAHAEDGAFDHRQRQAAAVVVRTCEALVSAGHVR
ncbi:hypothetical protein V5P93_006392 [Actinokineospora auranticolor]|uniref:Dynamin family protein n=1 Tax=Actinokineospora auranticolor TaxID=155976 RepID=A0A2S6GFN7_9PSEU|nr:hypothetical protein [Actinokineospora auranticolor]PPK64043.1 hypothetical protein CLV40_12234 [Actinokineospora auranticolor]